MNIAKKTTNRGIVRLILIIIVALLVLSYFGISLRTLVNAPVTQDNISYTASTTASVWNTYLKTPATYLYNQIFLDLIWNPAIHNLQNLRDGQPSTIQPSSPIVPSIPAIPR